MSGEKNKISPSGLKNFQALSAHTSEHVDKETADQLRLKTLVYRALEIIPKDDDTRRKFPESKLNEVANIVKKMSDQDLHRLWEVNSGKNFIAIAFHALYGKKGIVGEQGERLIKFIATNKGEIRGHGYIFPVSSSWLNPAPMRAEFTEDGKIKVSGVQLEMGNSYYARNLPGEFYMQGLNLPLDEMVAIVNQDTQKMVLVPAAYLKITSDESNSSATKKFVEVFEVTAEALIRGAGKTLGDKLKGFVIKEVEHAIGTGRENSAQTIENYELSEATSMLFENIKSPDPGTEYAVKLSVLGIIFGNEKMRTYLKENFGETGIALSHKVDILKSNNYWFGKDSFTNFSNTGLVKSLSENLEACKKIKPLSETTDPVMGQVFDTCVKSTLTSSREYEKQLSPTELSSKVEVPGRQEAKGTEKERNNEGKENNPQQVVNNRERKIPLIPQKTAQVPREDKPETPRHLG